MINFKVDLLIQPEPYAHDKSLNVSSPIDMLKENGINIYKLSNRFYQAHYKMIIIDDQWGMVSSGNLDRESFDGVKTITPEPCRDFAITITNTNMIQELSRVFQFDISDIPTTSPHPQLVWGPDHQRRLFLNMINQAKKSIRIYQQSIQDNEISHAMADAARRGVTVEIIMMPFPFSRTEDQNIPNQELIRQAGGKVYLHQKHYIHAKMMMIDQEVMYIGSCNFYGPSIDKTRELGILTSDKNQIEIVSQIFEKDSLNISE